MRRLACVVSGRASVGTSVRYVARDVQDACALRVWKVWCADFGGAVKCGYGPCWTAGVLVDGEGAVRVSSGGRLWPCAYILVCGVLPVLGCGVRLVRSPLDLVSGASQAGPIS